MFLKLREYTTKDQPEKQVWVQSLNISSIHQHKSFTILSMVNSEPIYVSDEADEIVKMTRTKG